ncbi:MAG: ABC transporter permease [Candidatus Thermoplasmatota archaeon]|jgi:ABC-2 type transport system permease protein|nr:ABC transporter permease [Candidatus Thermoplasmatota archaeon]
MLKEQIKGSLYIALKDLKMYYFKPPNLSWGIMFPIVMALAFILRNPSDVKDLASGLIAMSILFAATSAEAIVIVFERKTKTFERLLLAPLSFQAILFGKVIGGVIFGFLVSSIFLFGTVIFLGIPLSNTIFLLGALVLSAFVFAVFGTLVSVAVKEIFDAMTLANFFRFPMIFLCGVFIPVSALPSFLHPLAYVLPLTYSVDLIRFFITGSYDLVHPAICAVVLIFYSLVLFYLAAWVLKRRIEQ